MSKLPIRKFLDLSTGHLREETCDQLNALEGLHPYETEHGWFLYATPNAAEYAEKHDWPQEVLPILELARANDCDYVMFDADAPEVDGLPYWEW